MTSGTNDVCSRGDSEDATRQLVADLGTAVRTPVDELHLAAELESRGVTDRLAREQYGQRDVFALAKAIGARVPAPRRLPRSPRRSTRLARIARRRLPILAHGPLYAVLSLVYPAVFTWLGPTVMVRGLLLATGLGWVISTGVSTAAHGLVGASRPHAAARLLRAAVPGSLALALVAGLVLAATGPGEFRLLAFVVAQVGFQLATCLLVFYGLEIRLAIAMAPASLAGALYLVFANSGLSPTPALITAALSCALVVVVAVDATRNIKAPSDPPRPANTSWWRPWRPTAGPVLANTWYAAMCAVFLLYTNAGFVTDRFALAIAIAPLVLAMGALEWRSYRFTLRADALLRSAQDSIHFGVTAWRILIQELAASVLVLGGLAIVLLGVLAVTETLTTTSALLVDAHVVFGAALFAGFVLANLRCFGWLIPVVTAVVAGHVVATATLSARFDPHGGVPIFVASSAILLAALLVGLRRSITTIHRYR